MDTGEDQSKFDQKIQKLIEDEMCFVLMESGKFPQILVNLQTKEGPYLTFLIDIAGKHLFCLEPKNFPSRNVSDIRRRKHVAIDDDLLEYFKSCKLIRNFLKRYIDYCKKHSHQEPKEAESVWISNLNNLEVKTNNRFAAAKQ